MAKNDNEKKSVKIDHEFKEDRDELVDSLSEMLNKNFKDLGKVSFNLEMDDNPSDIKDWVSSGSTLLDFAISNRANGGFPAGRISEVNGLESAGKSLIAAHALVDTMRQGGIGVLIDTEDAVCKQFLKAIGMDLKNLNYNRLQTVEDIFRLMEDVIGNIRKSNKNRLVTIVVDSLAAATTKDELEDTFDLTGFNTKKAIIISKALRKITSLIADQRICVIITNQLRERVGFIGLGDKYISPGGKALGFHASVRVRLQQAGQIKNSDKQVLGIKTKAKVYKNRMGPPHRIAEFDLYFDRGVSDYDSWIATLLEKKILRNAKALKDETPKKKSKVELEEKVKLFGFTLSTGEEVTFERKTFEELITTRPEVRKELYDKLAEVMVVKYKDPNSILQEEVEVVEGEVIDEE